MRQSPTIISKPHFWLITISALAIVVVCAASTLYFLQSLGSVREGIASLQKGSTVALNNPPSAEIHFRKAANSFETISSSERRSLASNLGAAIPPFSWFERLKNAALHLSIFGAEASVMLADAPSIEGTSDAGVILQILSRDGGSWIDSRTDTLNTLEARARQAAEELRGIPTMLDSVSPELRSLRASVNSLESSIQTARSIIKRTRESLGLGKTESQTLLIMFQNSDEVRTTGGFPGTYTTITAQGGIVETFDIDTNIYKLDRQFEKRNPEKPEGPLLTITPYLGFRDSTVNCAFLNDCSQRAARLFAGMSGKNPNAIIYINSTLLERVVRQLGSVTLQTSSGAREVKGDNINQALTEEIERDYFESTENKIENEPKTIIAELLPVLIKELSSTRHAAALPVILHDAIEARELQFWSSDGQFNELLSSLQRTPQPQPEHQDYLHVVGNNLGGLKSSRKVAETRQLSRNFIPGTNRVRRSLTITRTHTGTGTWPDGVNKHHIDVYLPHEAFVREIPVGSGGEYYFEPFVYEAAGVVPGSQAPSVTKTALGTRVSFWATVAPGETREFKVVWEM